MAEGLLGGASRARTARAELAWMRLPSVPAQELLGRSLPGRATVQRAATPLTNQRAAIIGIATSDPSNGTARAWKSASSAAGSGSAVGSDTRCGSFCTPRRRYS